MILVIGVIGAIAAFAIGSIPFGVIVSRTFFKRDIRAEGSGNIGAANALRTLGKGGAATVLLLDALKGALPVLAVAAATESAAWAALAGLAAILGHCFSPFLGGKGGKGVATFYGILWALAWPAGATFTILWIATLIATGFASVASIVATLAMWFVLWFVIGPPGLVFGIAAAIIIIYAHRENIGRLRAGTESVLPLFGMHQKAKP
jgi:acyl phosphate:glycerol-3-phosphate acyltransferase